MLSERKLKEIASVFVNFPLFRIVSTIAPENIRSIQILCLCNVYRKLNTHHSVSYL